jgi:hypothetical protein
MKKYISAVLAFVVFLFLVLVFSLKSYATHGDFTASNVVFDATNSPAVYSFDYSGYAGGTIQKVYITQPGNHSLSGISNVPNCTANHCEGEIDVGVGPFPQYCADNFTLVISSGTDYYSQSLPGSLVTDCLTTTDDFVATNVQIDTTVSPATYSFDYSGYNGGAISKIYLSQGNNHLFSGAANFPTCTASHCEGEIDQGIGAFPVCGDNFHLVLSDGTNRWSQQLSADSSLTGCVGPTNTPTPTPVPMEPFGEGTFTASNYSFDPVTHLLQFTASNFNPPRTSGIGVINDVGISLYNQFGQLVLDYFSYNTFDCFEGNLFNLTTVFDQEVCYNEFWHADLPTNDSPVYLRIAQSASGNYRSQPIPANELLTTIPSPTPEPTGTPTEGTFIASDYSYDPVTHKLTFTASNFDPPRSVGTGEVNDFGIALYNKFGQLVLDYYSYNTFDCFEGNLFNLTVLFDKEVCYNEFWHADLPTNDSPIYLRIAQSASGNYRSQPIPANQLPRSVTLNAFADTHVRSGQGNHNYGAVNFMRVQASGDNRGLVLFDQEELDSAIGSGAAILSAKLRVTITDNGNNWGVSGRTVDVHRLIANWAEGNGTESSNGTGSGATWNCAIDSIISNSAKNCSGSTEWEMGQPNNPSVHPWVQTATDTETIINNQSGVIEYDVTSDVAAFMSGTNNYGWIIKKTNENQTGSADFGTRESSSVPQLVVTYQP